MKQHVQWRWLWLLIALMVVLPGGVRAHSAAWPITPAGLAASPASATLQGFDLLTDTTGWLWAGDRLYWTTTGGQSWDDITPLTESVIQAVAFRDTHAGWLVLADPQVNPLDAYTLARTADSGQTWQLTPLTLALPEVPVAALYLTLLDAQTGWLVIQQATGSNFSQGFLFKTVDGGQTWTALPIPLGEPVYFINAQVGWTAGGPAGDELYRTADGGQTWERQTPARAGRYRLPYFANEREGILTVQTSGDTGGLEFYHTTDGGRRWQRITVVSLPAESRVAAISQVTPDLKAGLLVAAGQWQRFALLPEPAARLSFRPQPGPEGIVALDLATAQVGWAYRQTGECHPAADAPAAATECLQSHGLLRTADGGQSWQPLPLPEVTTATWRVTVPVAAPQPLRLSSQTQIFQGQGFDKCEIATLSQLGNWVTNSPYRAVNLYIGGACRACANTALTASFVAQASQQGWKFIPTWVGPQAPCYSGCSGRHISSDPATAYNEGVSNADAAIAAAANLGLTLPDQSGTLIYYDLEVYDTTNATCHNAAMSFISGWTARLHERGNQAGIYGYGPAINATASLPNVPDAIWPAHWIYSSYNANATVWNAYGIPNTSWVNHQRLRQYAGGHNETWGGVTLNIDCDVADGPVAAIDQIAPTTAHTLSGAGGENGWYTSAVQVTLNASDNSGGSGLKLTQYRVDGGSWQTYGGPFTVSGEGSHTVYYKSQDNAGNWEAEKSVTFRLDTVAPAAPTQAASGCAAQSNVWQNSCADPSFTFSGASDATSGIAGYQLYWGSDPNGTSDYWTGSPTFDPGAPGEGSYYFRARAKDNAGHWSDWVTLFTFRYDATAPTGAVTINQNASVTYATLVRLFPSGSDALSGLAEVRFRDAGGAWSNWVSLGTTLWQLPGPTGQTFSVEMQVRDRAGNESAVYADTIALNIYPARPASAGYRLTRSTWGAAAVERASARYRLLSTLGQPSLIGSLTSSSYRLTSGYWAGYRPVQRVYLPLVLRNR